MAKSKLSETKENNPVLDAVIASIIKDYGVGSIMKFSDKSQNIEAISTGSLKINHASGIGGFPKGRIVEIYGNESTGKTTLLLQTIASAQKEGMLCAIIDAEHTLDKSYAEALGVDVSKLFISQPDSGEAGLEIAQKLIRSNQFGIVGIDSVAALVPKCEIEGEISDTTVGAHARLMSKALKIIVGDISKSNTCLIFLNQLRNKIQKFGYGDPMDTTGGNALKFYASMRIELKKIESKENYNTVRIKFIKNKTAPPYKICEARMVFGEGFSQMDEVIDICIDNKDIVKSGSWYSIGGERVQGNDGVKEYLKKNPKEFERLRELAEKSLVHVDDQEMDHSDVEPIDTEVGI